VAANFVTAMVKSPKKHQDNRNGHHEATAVTAASAVADRQSTNGGAVDESELQQDKQESRTESRRSSRASTLTPEKLLEGLVDFPSLYWWDVAAPGRLTLAALMKIGLIYSAVWTVAKIDSTLRKILVVSMLYRFVIGIYNAVAMSVVFFARGVYNGFNWAVRMVPIKCLHHLVISFERAVVKFLYQQDAYVAFRIKEYLWTHPRLQETFLELVDDLLHDVTKASCSSAHPNSTLSRCEQINNAFEGLNKKSFEVETN